MNLMHNNVESKVSCFDVKNYIALFFMTCNIKYGASSSLVSMKRIKSSILRQREWNENGNMFSFNKCDGKMNQIHIDCSI